MSTEKFLSVEALAKTYPGSAEPVFDQVNFSIARGEFVCLIGHSGCGKSTVLSMAAGLTPVTNGWIFLAGNEILGPGPDR
ncbi:MAG: ATP-binding cassette domain-containing protein, partial [Burkholderiaceae bacterium]